MRKVSIRGVIGRRTRLAKFPGRGGLGALVHALVEDAGKSDGRLVEARPEWQYLLDGHAGEPGRLVLRDPLQRLRGGLA